MMCILNQTVFSGRVVSRFKRIVCPGFSQAGLALILLLMLPVLHAEPVLIFNQTAQAPLNTEHQDGFVDELLREALKRVGYKIIIQRLPAERGLRNANAGLIDGEMTRVKGIEKLYPNLVRIPEKIMDWEFCVFSRKTIPMKAGWESLVNKEVAFITGWKILEKNVPASASVTRTRSSEQLFTLLKINRTDFIIYERWGGNRTVLNMKLSKVRMLKPCLVTREMYSYIHKKHKLLVPLIARSLREMKKDGSYSKLAKKHLKRLNRSH